jgi:ABC-type branched-subunit amino acid transport system substrate-binding protein
LYKDKNGKAPESSFVGAGGDILALINRAVETAGSTDPKAVASALAGIEDFQAVTGKYTYKDKSGVPTRDFLMIVPAKDNKSFAIRNTVKPDGSVN